jgi:hypothetical protein
MHSSGGAYNPQVEGLSLFVNHLLVCSIVCQNFASVTTSHDYPSKDRCERAGGVCYAAWRAPTYDHGPLAPPVSHPLVCEPGHRSLLVAGSVCEDEAGRQRLCLPACTSPSEWIGGLDDWTKLMFGYSGALCRAHPLVPAL